ncbi:transglutaminase-like domain-containing protein [Gryllotalpicola koreensis]|uniref:Transglutaminase family protein n=1 Tax=Gryllotalpicola koreensis TaxID=993086 RepID=A0ABP8AAY2_9MICO
MQLIASAPIDYLGSDDVIQSASPQVVNLARQLRVEGASDAEFARVAYEWVRDEVAHSWDAQDSRVTLSAEEVLDQRVGLCFAKSHLFAALLRSQGIPAGLCYQRLGNEEDGHVLHGLVAIYLDDGWHRLDVRGNNDRVNAQFSLSEERLAWPVDPERGERDYPVVHTTVATVVRAALAESDDAITLCLTGLPDALPE